MARLNRTHRELSKLNTSKTYDQGEWVGNESVNTGSLQRIADACELMATNYIQLQRNEKYWKERAEENEACAKKAQRRIVALKGVITKLKNR